DTLRSVDGGTVDRNRLVAVQTPQGFDLETLLAAHAIGADATDDAGVVELSGVPVIHVDGSAHNLKITFPHDLVVAQALLDSLDSDEKE
ncbi:MAG: IspD/TarI family cytidylyltransferase, partial [Acidimicrobiales bacterium]